MPTLVDLDYMFIENGVFDDDHFICFDCEASDGADRRFRNLGNLQQHLIDDHLDLNPNEGGLHEELIIYFNELLQLFGGDVEILPPNIRTFRFQENVEIMVDVEQPDVEPIWRVNDEMQEFRKYLNNF